MNSESNKKKSFRREREFGLIVGGILAGLGGWWTYRGKLGLFAPALLSVGALLVLLGLAFPRSLALPYRAWMGLAAGLSFISTRVILAIVFFLIVTPIGLIKRLTGWDPLRRRAERQSSYWQPYSERQRDARHYEKMF
jgi:hypothetical protein